MANFEEKRRDWDTLAKTALTPEAQVGRPFSDAEWQELLADISAKLGSAPGTGALLDIGCGNGLVLKRLSSSFVKLAGIDYSDTMIAAAKKLLPAADLSIGAADRLRFGDAAFTHVLCYSICHYFPDVAYVKAAVSEMVRVAQPGGTILFGDVLDQRHEGAIKSGSDKDIEMRIPSILRYSEWLFLDLEALADFACGLPGVTSVEILEQPADFKLSWYRRDIRICL